jgi:hypothetical protein
VTCAIFGGACSRGFLAGLSAVDQDTATSIKRWDYGSKINPTLSDLISDE